MRFSTTPRGALMVASLVGLLLVGVEPAATAASSSLSVGEEKRAHQKTLRGSYESAVSALREQEEQHSVEARLIRDLRKGDDDKKRAVEQKKAKVKKGGPGFAGTKDLTGKELEAKIKQIKQVKKAEGDKKEGDKAKDVSKELENQVKEKNEGKNEKKQKNGQAGDNQKNNQKQVKAVQGDAAAFRIEPAAGLGVCGTVPSVFKGVPFGKVADTNRQSYPAQFLCDFDDCCVSGCCYPLQGQGYVRLDGIFVNVNGCCSDYGTHCTGKFSPDMVANNATRI